MKKKNKQNEQEGEKAYLWHEREEEGAKTKEAVDLAWRGNIIVENQKKIFTYDTDSNPSKILGVICCIDISNMYKTSKKEDEPLKSLGEIDHFRIVVKDKKKESTTESQIRLIKQYLENKINSKKVIKIVEDFEKPPK